MGVYLVPFDVEDLGEPALVDRVLSDAGLPGLGTLAAHDDSFEEKLIADMGGYTRLADELLPRAEAVRPALAPGAAAHPHPATVADLWLPFEFSGVLVVPDVTGIYQDELTIASSVDIVRQHEAIAAAIDFPLSSVPALESVGYVVNDWHEAMAASEDPNDPLWRREPDLAFYLAVFWAVARCSVDRHAPVSYC